MTELNEIVALLDSTLRVAEVKDAPVALNGLQVENNGRITKVALAVDGSQRTLDAAVAAGADLLVLHHGLYWCGLRPLTGWWKRKVETCLGANLAVYAAHLPLDVHPELGNNARLAQALGLQEPRAELEYCLSGVFPGTVAELRARYAEVTGGPITGPMLTPDAAAGRVIICSGGGGPEVYAVQKLGYSTFLTGEENHWVSYTAEDMGMNLFFAGHYATETFGVKALGELLSERFGLPVVFLDNPTGM
nr:Nif3-like dinuclear metal center hexameric protein [Akkermansia sp.]